MSSGSDLTKKIIETKRQTEELKSQLQNLIDNGKNLVCPSHSKQNLITNEDGTDENLLTSQNKVQILKSYDKHSNINQSSIPADKTDVILVSPKKTKAYDAKEAREYMKKQKERLLVKQKQAQEEQKIKTEIQKKKLQELSKKCKELLVKNVKSHREKSKSSDRSNFVRLDESSNIPTNLRRAISLGRVDTVSATQRNPNLLYPPEPHFNKYSLNKKKSKEVDGQIVILARNYTRPGEDNVSVKSKKGDISCTQNIKTNFAKIKSNSVDKNIDQIENSPKQDGPDVQSKDKISLEKNSSKLKNLEITLEKKLKPHVSFNSHEENRIIIPGSAKSSTGSIKNILEYRSSNSSKSPNVDNGKINSPTILQANGEVAAIENKKPLETINIQSAETKVALNEKDKETINKCSVEIQTETSNKAYPKWLDEQPPQAYPFNFINTIKRKLQFANVQEPVLDIGIQSSVVKPAHHGEIIEPSKSPESKTVKRSDLRSFISHKCLNLDPKTIQHLELVSNKNFQDTNTIFRNLQTQTTRITETESESDTSKNIPEISSESGTSLKKNAESVRKAFMSNKTPSINTDRIDNMKLGQHKIATNKVSIRTESELPSVSTEIPSETKSSETVRSKSQYEGNTLSVDKRYIADFDSDIDLSSESLDRSRRSIISYNRSGYNQVFITSPEILSKSIPDGSDVNTEMILSKSIENVPRSVVDIESPLKTNSSYSKYEKSSKKLDKNIRKEEIQTDLRKSDEKTTSSKNYSAHTETRPSSSIINSLSKSDISLRNINTRRGSSTLNKSERSEIPPLIEPAASLVKISNQEDDQDSERRKKLVKNISVRSSKISTSRNTNDANQIHLKFEAEIHLLNDFNQSLRTFSKLEQALETLKTNNNITTSNILQHNDTPQTSLNAQSKTSSKISENVKSTHSDTSKVNYSRGSFINTSLDDLNLLSNTAVDLDNDSVISTGLEINSINHSVKVDDPLSNFENLQSVNFAGLSINMFEQLIKDEDARLENLKTILKIREQALLDRTKGELSWLEIQRKHFKETGHLHEASVIKKKQRGILVNHQKEKHEMQRLKQMQKAASIERKIVLKEQRNLIRQQLFTDNMITKMKVNTPRERRSAGPLKVLQSHTESIRSETSISRRGSSDRDKDRLSVTSRHSVVSEISEIEISSRDISSNEHRKFIKKTLLLREAALKKRRKSAEDLLEWHKKLLEEEKRIAVLESTASAIISQKPPEKFNFKGNQLNQLWFNLTDSDAKKFVDDKIYPMSQIALERFCKSAREFSNQTKSLLKKNSDNEIKTKVGVSENVPRNNSEKDYMSDFENESNIDVVDQSIDILINNFNKIQDDISTLSIIQTKKSDEITADDRTESEADISSVIETNRTDVKEKTKDSSSSAEEVKETIDDSIPTIDQDSSEKSKSEEILEEKSNEDKQEETESEDSAKIKLSSRKSNSAKLMFSTEDRADQHSTEILSQKLKLPNEEQSVILSDQHSSQKSTEDRVNQHSTEIFSHKLKISNNEKSVILSDQHSTQKSEDDISEDSAKTKDSTGSVSQKSKSSQSSAKLKLLTEDQSIILSDQHSTQKSTEDRVNQHSTEILSHKLKPPNEEQSVILSDQHSTQKSEDDISEDSAKTKDSTGSVSQKSKSSQSSAKLKLLTEDQSIILSDQHSTQKSTEDRVNQHSTEILSHKLKPPNEEQSVILSDQHSTQKSEDDISEDSAKTKDSTGRPSQKSKSSQKSAKLKLLTGDQSIILSDQHSTQKSDDDISEDSAKTKDSTGRISQKSKSSQKSDKFILLTDDQSIILSNQLSTQKSTEDRVNQHSAEILSHKLRPTNDEQSVILSDQHSTQKSEDDISEESAKTKGSTGRLSQKSKSSQKSAKLKLLTDDQSIILSDQHSTQKSEDDISEDSAKTKDSTGRLAQKSKSSQKSAKLKLLTDDQSMILSDQHSTQKSENDISEDSAKTKDSTGRISQKSKSSQSSAKLKLLSYDQSIILSDQHSTQKSEDDISEDSAKTKDSTGRVSQKSKSSQKSAKLNLLTDDQSIILSDQHSTKKSEDISEDSAKTKDSTGRVSQKSKSSQKSAKLKLLTEDQSIILSDQHSTQKSEEDISEDSAKTKDSTGRPSQMSKSSQSSAKLKLLTDDQSLILSNQHSTQKSGTDISEDSAKTKDSTGRISQKSKSSQKSAKLKLLTDDQSIILSVQHSTQKSENDISEDSAKTKDSTGRPSQKSKSSQSSAKLKLLPEDQSIIVSDQHSTKKSEDDISEDSAKTKDSSLEDSAKISSKMSKSKSLKQSSKLKLSLEEDISVSSEEHSFNKSKSRSSKIPLSSSHRSNSLKSSDELSKNLTIDSDDPKISEKSKSLEVEEKVSEKSKSDDIHDKQDQSRSEKIDPAKDFSEIKYSSELSSSKQQINEERDTLDDGVPTIGSNSSLLDEEEDMKDPEEILLQDSAGEEQEKRDDEELPPIANETKENLNESQEILLMLGESEIKTSSDEDIPHIQIKDSLNTSQEILSKLEENLNKSDNSDEDLLSESFMKLCQISNLEKSDASGLQVISSPEDCNKSVKDRELEETSDRVLLYDFCDDLTETNVDEINEDVDKEKLTIEEIGKEGTSDIEDKSEAGTHKSNLTFKIDENNENQTFLNNLVASSTIIDFQQETHDDSDESKLALSDKSNESFVINEIHEDSNDKPEEQNLVSKITSRDEDNEESESSEMTSHFSYGVLERNEEKETSDSFETDVPVSKEEVNSFEEKEHDSLSSPNDGSSSEALNLEEQSLAHSESSKNEEISKSESRSVKDSVSEEISPKDIAVDVKKRVSEILADTNISRGDKSPRLQDLYVTTYDLISPANSPEKDAPSSPKEEHKLVTSIFDSEAEEILRKQLAVEEEIKAITEQQQKEQQLPLMYIREIPNKPPPPYTPPSSLAPVPVPTIIPTSDEIEEITMYSAKILHKAYLSNNLANVNISNNTLSLISKDITKDCYKFVFDLCKDIAREHYKQFEEDKSPSWLRVSKKPELTLVKPLDTEGLKTHMIEKLKEVFGYRKRNRRENTIIKWSRKKRDHVDEILVMECQQEEAQWTNYQKDELLVKDQITNEIFDSLLNDTANILKKIFLKKS